MRLPCALSPRRSSSSSNGYTLLEAAIRLRCRDAPGGLLIEECPHARSIASLALVDHSDANRAAMDWDALDTFDEKVVAAEESLERCERVIEQVLVIDGVELEIGQQILDVRRLHHERPIGREEEADALDHTMDVGNMGHHVVRKDDVGPNALVDEAPGELGAKDLHRVGIPRSSATFAMLRAGSIPSTGMPAS